MSSKSREYNMIASFGQKKGMTQVFKENGQVVPVTQVQLLPDVRVNSVITEAKEGYNAIQLAAQYSRIHVPQLKSEIRVSQLPNDVEEGESMDISKFEPEMVLTVTGTSKGKGFAGVIKRHGFSGKDATHGTKHDERRPGSIGGMFPQNVRPGRKMPGRDGNKKITLKGREIVDVDPEQNLILIKGSLPGPNKGILKLSSV